MRRRSFRMTILITALTIVCAAIALTVALANQPDNAPEAREGNNSQLIVVQCPDDFNFSTAVAAPDGTILLSGTTGPNSYKERKVKATMIRCDLEGNILWELYTSPEAGDAQRYSYTYENTSFIGKNRIAAILTGPGYEDTAIDYAEDGRVTSRASNLPQPVNSFLALPDGMLIEGNPDDNSARIVRLNESEEILWQLIWPERMRIAGLATNGEIYAAYGGIDIQRPDGLSVPDESVIIVFDGGGNILWRRDIPTIDSFVDCVWEDGKLVLAGEFPVTIEQFGDKWTVNNGVVTAFDEGGETLFNTEYRYPEDGFTQGFMKSIIKVGSGFIACADPFPSKETKGVLRMIALDSSGNITSRWAEKFDGMQSFNGVSLVSIDNKPYAVAGGLAQHDPLPEDDDGNIIAVGTIPYVTAIKPINIPVSEGRE